MLNFAPNDFPLEWMVTSIDTALQSVQGSLQTVGATLGLLQSSKTDQPPHTSQKQAHPVDEELKHGISAEVIRQLRQAGLNIEFMTSGELQDANHGFEADGRVIDDPEDSTLRGKLKRTEQEVDEREERKEPATDSEQNSFVQSVLRRRRRMSAPPSVLSEREKAEAFFTSSVQTERSSKDPPTTPSL